MTRDYVFQADIDNQSEIKEVRNYMIGPVFPHRLEADGDLFPQYEYDREQPIGILQLLNKSDH